MSEQATADERTQSTTDGPEEPAAARPTGRARRAIQRRPRLSRRHVRSGATFLRGGAAFLLGKIADVVWLAASLCAAVLAIGALLVALKANADNPVVQWFTDGATWLAGPLSTVFEFQKENGSADVAKNKLVNWGIAALAFLVVGRLAHRLIRPSS